LVRRVEMLCEQVESKKQAMCHLEACADADAFGKGGRFEEELLGLDLWVFLGVGFEARCVFIELEECFDVMGDVFKLFVFHGSGPFAEWCG
jgi:hypothetical protein